MTTLFQFIVSGVALAMLIPVIVFFLEVTLAVGPSHPASAVQGERRRLAVLMPAHNEATIIASALRSVAPQLHIGDRLIVIADNCVDETAAIAASAGAEVIVRTDSARRGKGYALDFGMRFLEQDPPEVVIIIDADCQIGEAVIDQLTRKCVLTGRPIQALYLMRSAPGTGLRTRIAEFAWVVKNHVRALGLHRLSFPCQLMGTGMAFPWRILSSANLATGHIVEDLKLGIDLASIGTPPVFCPEALVTSCFPTSSAGTTAQRARWEHGHLGVILTDAPRLFARSLAKRDLNMLVMALDLSVPPLALLTLQIGTVFLVSGFFYLITKSFFPIVIATIAGALLVVAVLLSWAKFGRRIVSLGSLSLAMIYAIAKVPLYGKFIVARQLDWVRSKRDNEKP